MKPLCFMALFHLLSASFLASFLVSADPASEWQGKKVPQLVLASGKTYTGVTFSKVDPDAVTITHSGGILRIPMEHLRPEAQAALGYDPEKAVEARKRYEAETAAVAAATARRVAAERAEMAAKAEVEEWRAAARNIIVKVTQVTDTGVLGHVNGSDDLEFVEFDTANYNLHDGWEGGMKAVLMEKPYRYTSVLGATKTVRRWVLFEE